MRTDLFGFIGAAGCVLWGDRGASRVCFFFKPLFEAVFLDFGMGMGMGMAVGWVWLAWLECADGKEGGGGIGVWYGSFGAGRQTRCGMVRLASILLL